MPDKKAPKVADSKTKKTVSMRDKAKLSSEAKPKKRRLQATAKSVGKPIQKAHSIGKKEYSIPMPDNKIGRFLGKRRRIIPRFFVEAFGELRQVTWPTRKETIKLTFAVIIFSAVFGVAIAIVDYGLDKVFRELLLK